MSDRTERLDAAFAALDEGDPSGFASLFSSDARWLGIPGIGVNGTTPI
jgi:ketosteroid isomerase-like protein